MTTFTTQFQPGDDAVDAATVLFRDGVEVASIQHCSVGSKHACFQITWEAGEGDDWGVVFGPTFPSLPSATRWACDLFFAVSA